MVDEQLWAEKKVILEDFSHTASNLRDTDKTVGVVKTLVFAFDHILPSSAQPSCSVMSESLWTSGQREW